MTKQSLELRTSVSFSEREETSEGLIVRGIVNKPGEWSQPLASASGSFIERVMPNVFKQAITRNSNIKFLDRHNKDLILASTKNGSLKLEETAEGLLMEARIAPTSYGKDAYELIKAGEMAQMSFGMQVLDDTWSKLKDGSITRSITELFLSEVSVVPDPAYLQSAIEARSSEVVEIEVPQIEERDYSAIEDVTTLESLKKSLQKEGFNALQKIEAEKRAITPSEELQQTVIQNELRDINSRIQELTNKTKKDDNTMENITKVEEVQESGLNEIRKAFDAHIRGQELKEEEKRMLLAEGSTLIPTLMEETVIEKILTVANVFAKTKSYRPVHGKLEILVEEDIQTADWVVENQALFSKDFTVSKVELDQKRVGSIIEVTQQLLNDSGIDILSYIENVLARRIGNAINTSVIAGNGDTDNQFEGILNAGITPAVTASAVGTTTVDELQALALSIPQEFRNGGVFIVSEAMFKLIAKLKDGNGHYYLNYDVANNETVYKLFGHEILVSSAMPAPTTGKQAVIFANLAEGYATMVKQGVQLKKLDSTSDEAARGVVKVLVEAYMDGKVANKQAIAILAMP